MTSLARRRMTRWQRNVLALGFGVIAGLVILEVGLATIGRVQKGFWPGKTTVKLTATLRGVCYSPVGSSEFQYDARLRDDHDYLKGVITGADSSSRMWTFDRLLDETPLCQLFEVNRGRLGGFPSRDVQIPVLGDSFAFGEGLPEKATVWAALGREFPGANFPNVSFRGANIDDIPIQLDIALTAAQDRTPPAQVMQVLYFYNLNDLDTGQDQALQDRFSQLDNESHLLSRFGPSGWLEEVLAQTHLYWFFARWQARAAVSQETIALYRALYAAPEYEGLRQSARAVLRSLNQRLRAAGIDFTVVLYPLLATDGEGDYRFADIHRIVLGWCEEDGLDCLDGAEPVLSAGSLDALVVHPDDHHPSRLANAAMARFVAGELSKRFASLPPTGH